MAYPNMLFMGGSARPGENFAIYTAKQWPLGTLLQAQDGRKWRYAENGGTAAVAGSLYQSELPTEAWDELVITATATTSRTITVTNSSTAIAADDFVDGYLNVEDDAGEGRLYLLQSHSAIASAVAGTLNFAPGNNPRVALTSATTVGLTKNPFKDVIIHPSPPTARVVGWANAAIPADQWGWIQTGGPVSALTDTVLLIFRGVMPSASVNGAVAVHRFQITMSASAAASANFSGTKITDSQGADSVLVIHGAVSGTTYDLGETEVCVGWCMEVAATTEHSLVHAMLE